MSLDFLENGYQDDSNTYSPLNFESGDLIPSPDTLKEQENADEQAENSENLYNPKKSNNKLSKKLFSAVKKNKALALAGGGIGGGVLVLIVLVFILAQQLPSFAALLASQSMARANRAFENNTTQLTSEDIALSEESSANKSIIESSYSDANTGGLLSKLKSYTPSGAINNLEGAGTLEYNYGKVSSGVGKLIGAKELKSITVNTPTGSQEFLASDIAPSKWDTVMHPLQTFNNRASSISDFSNALGSVDESGSVLLRFGVLKQLVSDLGGNPLSGIFSSKFINKSANASDIELDMEAQQAISPPSDIPVTPLTDALNSAVTDAQNVQNADATNPAAIENIIKNGGTQTDVNNAITKATSSLTNSSLLSKLSITYAIGVPACIIFDGSLQTPNANKTIDKQDSEVARTYLLVESSAAQEKAGQLNAAAAGAINRKLGNITQSNVYSKAYGKSFNTNSNILSPQAGVDGQYSIFSALFPQKIAGTINPIASKLCPILTSPKVAIAVIGAQVLSYIGGIFTGGLSDAVEVNATIAAKEAVDEALSTGISDITSGITQDVVSSVAANGSAKQIASQTLGGILKEQSAKLYEYVMGGNLTKTVGTTAGAVATTYGLTMLAQQVVRQDLGTTYNGYSQGTDFANQAAAGGNVLANQTMQHQYFGAPLSTQQVAINNASDIKYLAKQNSTKSAYQRYLAIDNPYSLISKLSLNLYSDITSLSPKSLIQKIASMINPTKLFSDLFLLFRGKTIAATPNTTDESNYGIVQWGYTGAEEALINPTTGDPSYQPLENAKALTQQTEKVLPSGQTVGQYIDSTYSPCFSDSMGTLLTTSPSTGPDTTDKYIVRSSTGDVIGGLCSQKYLGPNSMDPTIAPYGKDLIFRWRVDSAYQQSLDLLNGVQNANQ